MIDPSINLKCYTIRIRRRGEKDKYLNLNENVFGNKSFFDIAQDFIKHIETEPYVNKEENQKIYFEGTIGLDSKERLMSGTLRKGASGKEIDIVDIKDNTNAVIFKQKKEHAGTNPFYFLIAMPTKVNYGILIVQSFKHFAQLPL